LKIEKIKIQRSEQVRELEALCLQVPPLRVLAVQDHVAAVQPLRRAVEVHVAFGGEGVEREDVLVEHEGLASARYGHEAELLFLEVKVLGIVGDKLHAELLEQAGYVQVGLGTGLEEEHEAVLFGELARFPGRHQGPSVACGILVTLAAY
jgi:hypothetical protein